MAKLAPKRWLPIVAKYLEKQCRAHGYDRSAEAAHYTVAVLSVEEELKTKTPPEWRGFQRAGGPRKAGSDSKIVNGFPTRK